MSDTPRTDAELEKRYEPMSGLVWGDFARTLERELAACQALYHQAATKINLEGARELHDARLYAAILEEHMDSAGLALSKQAFDRQKARETKS